MLPYFKKISLAALLVSSAGNLFAQGNTADTESSFNPVAIALASLIVILLLAIAALGNVLRQLAYIYREKMRKGRNDSAVAKTILLLVAGSIASFTAFAQETANAAEKAVEASPFISGIPKNDFYALMFVIFLELVIVITMVLYMRVLLRALSSKPETAPAVKMVVKKIPFWDRFHGVVPIEKERDIMLDHDYDGIKELDNSLPPWWKYGFYFTILVAGVYLWYYHAGGDGPGSHEEYIAAVQKGEEQKAAYLAKTAGNIDESNVTMLDAAGIEKGKLLYEKNCVACHLNDGGGSVGPNLTDEYWLHGGSLPDIFKSIKYGWQDKGMKPWKDDFSPKQIAELTSYVRSLKGTKPVNPKEKQGDLYVEGKGESSDTTKTSGVSATSDKVLASK